MPRLPAPCLRRLLVTFAPFAALAACGGDHAGLADNPEGGVLGDAQGEPEIPKVDISAAILANQNLTLSADAIIVLPPGVTTYTGIVSGRGTIVLRAAGGTRQPSTLVITKTSTFTLPEDRQVEIVTKSNYPGMGYALDIAGSNPPVLTIESGVTLQIGTNGSADDHPNILCTSDSKNAASVVNGEVNLDNIRNDGALVLNSAQFILLGEISGSGYISQLPNVWGDSSMGGSNSLSGVLSLSAGQNFGTDHVPASLPNLKAVLDEGSWLVWAPPNHVTTISQNVYEAAFGNDINFHPIGNATIVMTGVYSHTDNSPHQSPNLDTPGLSDASLNLAKVIYRTGGAADADGNDASYRGVNIEAPGIVQWGDGTTNTFFLPSAPSPADVAPPLGQKNAYINLRRGGTLAFNYKGAVTLNVGITGGGGGPHRTGEVGVGNVTIAGTPGNDVTFAQPQDYNGTTTIGAGAILRLGAGKPVPLNYVTLHANGVKSTVQQATYTGDSSILTSESPRGAATDKIVNNGRLIVQNTTSAITLSHMSGTGSFTQAGPASVTLLANTYRGGTVIENGSVLAGDEMAFGPGEVTNHAVLGLAGAQRVIRVRGGYLQGKKGTLRLTLSPKGETVLHIEGRATLDGTLELVADGDLISLAGRRFPVVRAGGGITGHFRSVLLNGAPVPVSCDRNTCEVTVPPWGTLGPRVASGSGHRALFAGGHAKAFAVSLTSANITRRRLFLH